MRRHKTKNLIKTCIWCNMPMILSKFSRDIRFVDGISCVCDDCRGE